MLTYPPLILLVDPLADTSTLEQFATAWRALYCVRIARLRRYKFDGCGIARPVHLERNQMPHEVAADFSPLQH